MIKTLKTLFELPSAEPEAPREQRLRLAAAALLIETARADFHQDPRELAALEALLSTTLELDRVGVHELVELASEQADSSTSLYEFTRVINDHYSAEQKLQLIGLMWKVAYADGNLDKYEENLIRRVASLTYVPHQDYIRSKLQAHP